MSKNPSHIMQIGEFSHLTGIAIDTLRYYQKIGLLEPKHLSQSGYRLYNEENLQTAQFILSAKSLGFSLENINALLSIKLSKQDASCEDVKQFIYVQMKEIEKKLAELQEIHKAMERLYDNCCGGAKDAHYCSILQSLEKGLEKSNV